MPMQSMEHQNWEGMYPNLFPRKFEKLNFCVRFVIGRPLDNKARTDASFWHAGTKGYPSRWLRFPGYVRSIVRLFSLYLLLFTPVLLLAARLGFGEWVRSVLLSHLLYGGAVILLVAIPKQAVARGIPVLLPAREEREEGNAWAWRTVWIMEGRRQWERTKVIPVARVLAPLLQIEHRRLRPSEARQWVTVPRSYLSPKGKPVVIELPAHFSGVDERHQQRVVKAAGSRLGMLDPVPSWQLEGEIPRLLLSAPELPPEKVTFSMVRRFLENAEEYRPVLGMVSPEKVLQAEMIEDSPHILISAGPGAGKSSLLKALIAHFMHWGWGIVILDWKRTKQFAWLGKLSGVTYVTEIEKIHDMGVRLGEEVEYRMNNGMEGRAKLLIVRDEWNVTAVKLQDYWMAYRAQLEPEERRTTPTKSPALAGFATVDFAGREYGMHDMLAAQRASNRIFNFNTDMRDCFGIRILSRYSNETRRMLVGNMKLPKKSNLPGRWTVVVGEEVALVQAPWFENDEARAWAASGKPKPLSPFTTSFYPEIEGEERVDEVAGNAGVTGVTGAQTAAMQGKQLTHGVTGGNSLPDLDGDVIPSIKLMKLKDIADSLDYLGVTLKMLQHATQRLEQEFPPVLGGNQFKGYTYDFNAVKEWVIRRNASAVKEKRQK